MAVKRRRPRDGRPVGLGETVGGVKRGKERGSSQGKKCLSQARMFETGGDS
jgi:hypothetical protein